MKLDNSYHFDYSDYCLHFIVIFSTLQPMCLSAFFRNFLSNSEIDTKHNQVQELSYCNFFLLFLPVFRIEPATLPVSLPYVKSLVKKESKICSPYDIGTIFRSDSTLQKYFFRIKPHLPNKIQHNRLW